MGEQTRALEAAIVSLGKPLLAGAARQCTLAVNGDFTRSCYGLAYYPWSDRNEHNPENVAQAVALSRW
ncbi:hypothetical protein DOK_14959 [gamma proteobacterium BDW918]|nr:hypothetical protein DOK_14959 [gamma proteobacterium BDW918]